MQFCSLACMSAYQQRCRQRPNREFSNSTTSFATPPLPVPGSAILGATGTITTHTHFTDNIVRVGLNYQFH
jgi:hypothetical protein